MKIHAIIISLFLLTACVQGEPELNKRQARQIQKMVEYKVDSFRIAQEAVCYQTVLVVAKPKADSIILSFQMEASNDTLNRPERPNKPKKPKVEIPVFED
jgi:starvation-inducible outer membrane lipoprotein